MDARRSGWAASLLGCALLHPGVCGAQTGELSGILGASTDDVFRGVSLSDNQASAQGALNYVIQQWYAGASAEEVRRDPDRGASAEVIGYVGYRQPLGADASVAASLRHYDYPGSPYRALYNYDEVAVRAAWRWLSAAAIGSPDTFAADRYGQYGRGSAWCYELVMQAPLPWTLSADLGTGYYDLHREIGVGYAYWSAGLVRQWRSWQLDLRYIGTDAAAIRRFGTLAGNRVVFSALWSF